MRKKLTTYRGYQIWLDLRQETVNIEGVPVRNLISHNPFARKNKFKVDVYAGKMTGNEQVDSAKIRLAIQNTKRIIDSRYYVMNLV